MTTWRDKIGGCFGVSYKVFAENPSSENEAFLLLTKLRNEGIGWQALETETRNFLRVRGLPPSQADTQIQKMAETMKFWLDD